MKILEELLKLLADPFRRYIWSRFSRIPIAVAQSVPLARAMTVAGFSALSVALITFIVHIAWVQEKIRSNEEYSRDTGQVLAYTFARTRTVADVAAQALRSDSTLAADLQAQKSIIPTASVLQLSDAKGIAVVVNGRVFPFAGSLDPTVTDRGWNEQRWEALNLAMRVALQRREDVTLFLGLERVFRTQREIEQGQPFDGSLVLARAWRDTRVGWAAVVVMLPVKALAPSLHLGQDVDYVSGNYDYLVDCDGWVLLHPRPFLVNGTTLDGASIGSARNDSEIGKKPLNTRDAAWIAGGKMLSDAFLAMRDNVPRSVVYRNLRRQARLTSFYRVNLAAQGINGCLAVVAGKGLNRYEAITTPLLLRGPTALSNVLNGIVAVYGLLLVAWITFTMKLRSLHGDLLAWGRHVSAKTAEELDLLPIRNAPATPKEINRMVGVIVTLNVSPSLPSERLAELFNEFGGIATKLRDDGWIVSNWSLRSFFLSRPLTEESHPPHSWTPVNVVDYFRHAKSAEGDVSLFRAFGSHSCRAVYTVGTLQVHAARMGAIRRATISFAGPALTEALSLDDRVSDDPDVWWGWLVYEPHALRDVEIEIVGQSLTTSEGPLCRIPLNLFPEPATVAEGAIL